MAKLTVHEKALASIKIEADHPSLAWFKKFEPNWAKWGVDLLGSVPTPAMLAVATATCKNSPGIEGVNVAMANRPEGVKVSQYLNAAGAEGAAHNHLNTLVKGGIFDPIPRGAQVKCATLTEYGLNEVKRLMIAKGMLAAPKAKPAKAPAAVKVARKRNKAPAPAAAETPASEAPSPTEGTTSLPATVEAIAALADHFNA
jgi:hypothetical protein